MKESNENCRDEYCALVNDVNIIIPPSKASKACTNSFAAAVSRTHALYCNLKGRNSHASSTSFTI